MANFPSSFPAIISYVTASSSIAPEAETEPTAGPASASSDTLKEYEEEPKVGGTHIPEIAVRTANYTCALGMDEGLKGRL